MRGKVYDWDIKTLADGITPAYAGKSDKEERSKLAEMGSPPPMRGKDVIQLFDRIFCGITPAYAGKSMLDTLNEYAVQDHPRLCGEKSSGIVTSVPPSGSPPPMRGKGSRITKAGVRIGITPAYAGKSFSCSRSSNSGQDHPRLCGEKSIFIRIWFQDTGSPPPMRGKAERQTDFDSMCRITPAYAGKSAGIGG